MHIITKISDPNWWVENCLNDLFFLCRNVLSCVDDPSPGYKDLYPPTHKRLAQFLQQYAKPDNTCVILLPRGWLKSSIATIGFATWMTLNWWVRGERRSSIISNATIGNAKEFLWKYKYNMMYNELLRGLFREYIPEDPESEAARWTQEEIELNGCRIETGSAEGNLVSRHYNGFMFNDDLVNKENSETKVQLDKVVDWWRLSRSLKMPNCGEIIPGTRWAWEDLYGHIIEKHLKISRKQFEVIHRQPIFEWHQDRFHLFQAHCFDDPIERTGSTFPVLFPEKKIKEIIDEQGSRAGGQYFNDPLAMSEAEINHRWFRFFHEDDLPAIRNTLLLVDPTGKDNKESDYSAIVIAEPASDKMIYISFGKRKKVTDMKLAEWIVEIAIQYQPGLIGIEDNRFGPISELLEIVIPRMIKEGSVPEHLTAFARSILGMLIPLEPRGRNKHVRIRALSGWIESGKMLFHRTNTEDLRDELVRFPRTRRDDIMDACAYILDHAFPFPLRTDPEKILELPEDLKRTAAEWEKADWENAPDITEIDQSHLLDETDY